MPGVADFRPTGLPTERTTGIGLGTLLGADWDAWYRFVAAIHAAGGKVTMDSGSPYDYASTSGAVGKNPGVIAALNAYNQAVTDLRGAVGQDFYGTWSLDLGGRVAGDSLELDVPSLDSSPMLNNSADMLALPQQQGNPTFADELASLPMPAKVQQPLTLAQQLAKLARR